MGYLERSVMITVQKLRWLKIGIAALKVSLGGGWSEIRRSISMSM